MRSEVSDAKHATPLLLESAKDFLTGLSFEGGKPPGMAVWAFAVDAQSRNPTGRDDCWDRACTANGLLKESPLAGTILKLNIRLFKILEAFVGRSARVARRLRAEDAKKWGCI